ncbi:hypothetical protein [Streptomyces sp. NPDC096153]|uniref:hypothetical protein n=1 Tax=Streptomyces sp. NPDC096153 TaxID=3155548 RepID=UPI0033299A46
MEPEKRERHVGAEGCPAVAIRIPVRIVVLVLVVPVRMLWDVLVVYGKALDRALFRPPGRAVGWVHETLLAPVGRGSHGSPGRSRPCCGGCAGLSSTGRGSRCGGTWWYRS